MEQVHIVNDEYAAFPAVIADRWVIEIAVEGAQDIGAAHNGCVYYRVVIGIRGHDGRSGAGEHDLRNVVYAKKAQIFGYFLVGKFRGNADALII